MIMYRVLDPMSPFHWKALASFHCSHFALSMENIRLSVPHHFFMQSTEATFQHMMLSLSISRRFLDRSSSICKLMDEHVILPRVAGMRKEL